MLSASAYECVEMYTIVPWIVIVAILLVFVGVLFVPVTARSHSQGHGSSDETRRDGYTPSATNTNPFRQTPGDRRYNPNPVVDANVPVNRPPGTWRDPYDGGRYPYDSGHDSRGRGTPSHSRPRTPSHGDVFRPVSPFPSQHRPVTPSNTFGRPAIPTIHDGGSFTSGPESATYRPVTQANTSTVYSRPTTPANTVPDRPATPANTVSSRSATPANTVSSRPVTPANVVFSAAHGSEFEGGGVETDVVLTEAIARGNDAENPDETFRTFAELTDVEKADLIDLNNCSMDIARLDLSWKLKEIAGGDLEVDYIIVHFDMDRDTGSMEHSTKQLCKSFKIKNRRTGKCRFARMRFVANASSPALHRLEFKDYTPYVDERTPAFDVFGQEVSNQPCRWKPVMCLLNFRTGYLGNYQLQVLVPDNKEK